MVRDEVLGPDVDMKQLAKRTESFSGSDLKRSFREIPQCWLTSITDLCVAAALDAVKENVKLPWNVPHSKTLPSDSSAPLSDAPLATQGDAQEELKVDTKPVPESEASSTVEESTTPAEAAVPPRVIFARHFQKALSEITPSASETLGSLAELRKWNEEFGENATRKKRRMWGGRFGFMREVDGSATNLQPTSPPTPNDPHI